MKRLITGCLLAAVLVLCLAPMGTASEGANRADGSLPLREFVEQAVVPMALANDYAWRVNQDFSNRELGELIRACEAAGIALPEDSEMVHEYREGRVYEEESAIMEVCEAVQGCGFWEWTIADRQWLRGVMRGLGYEWEPEDEPGPEDLTEAEARAIAFSAIREAFGADALPEDQGLSGAIVTFTRSDDTSDAAEDDEASTCWDMTWWIGSRKFRVYLDRKGNVLAVSGMDTSHGSEQDSGTNPVTPALTKDEAVHMAAKAIRNETGVDVPLEDPAVYHVSAGKRVVPSDGLLYWDVSFMSRAMDWGDCSAVVRDLTGETRVVTADVGPVTADNIMNRFEHEYGSPWLRRNEWTAETWAAMSRMAAELPTGTFEGQLLKETPFIEPREGLLTRLEADEAAFRAAGLTCADIYCVVLIDADPHPVWKFCLEHSGVVASGYWDYEEFFLIEVDAVTGEVLDLRPWLYDREPSSCLYSLGSTWARVSLQMEGAMPMARRELLHTYGDEPLYLKFRLDDESYWKPEVRGLTVILKAQLSGWPDLQVSLDENGLPVRTQMAWDQDGLTYLQVERGDPGAMEPAVDLAGVLASGDIQPIRSTDAVTAAGNVILARCREHGLLGDNARLLSVTQYRVGGVFVFAFGEKTDITIAGGQLRVAVKGHDGSLIGAWSGE